MPFITQKALGTLLVIFLLAISANFSIDIHAPAMPVIVRQLGISVSGVQLTITLFLLAYGTFPLLFGPLSDHYGRRKLAITGLLFLTLGSVICTLATTAHVLLSGRFLQGIGASACVCLGRAILRDSYTGEEMAWIASLNGVAVELTLCMSPMFGGYLVTAFGWHSNFIFIIALSLAVLLFIIFNFQETAESHHKTTSSLSHFLKNGRDVLMNRLFHRYVWGSAAAFSIAMAYFTISPFVIQTELHYSAKLYGLITLYVTGALVLGSIINAALVKRLGCDKMIVIGLTILLMSGLCLLLLSISIPITLINFIIPSATAFFGIAFLFGNCVSGGLSPFAKQAGVASAIYTVTQISTAFVVTGIISLLSNNTSTLLSLIFLGTSSIALCLYAL